MNNNNYSLLSLPPPPPSSSPLQAKELCNLLNCFLFHPIYNDSTLSFNDNSQKKTNTSTTSNQTVSLSAAGMRALIYQLQSIYLRTPIKLFRPSRFDYLAYVRALANKHDNIENKPYRFRTHSSLGMIINVVRKQGWKFIPDQILPPLIANSATGVILYATYLTTLDYYTKQHNKTKTKTELQETDGETTTTTGRANFNWYAPIDTWRAGFVAGAVQSLAAAPVDAIYTRSTVAEMLEGSHENLWVFGFNKLREIGLIGVFAGYGFSLVKESVGFAFYFSTFEIIKTQGYNLTYKLINYYKKSEQLIKLNLKKLFKWDDDKIDEKLEKLEKYRSMKILKSSFILIAGASAAFSLLAVQYPISKIQKIHLSRLEALDVYNASRFVGNSSPFFKLYYNSYVDTYKQVLRMKQRANITWFEAAYSGFVRNALTTIPATSIALLVFEIMRTKLTDNFEDYNDVLEA
ncbi:mitochondrial ornithine carrier protein, putative [Candida dubliniensis CD36]|uniref:Mitochondrial thiamine pyrophosphate carrier 1 n=1 Tax=Candida dubliniensis (strain CD36 / ATCC MYA-646 / CBS 7987 / NCPF 3949 / NRRL Y-17841) TaxID=573826 RepID=B9WDA5_CANDC|nr:mitochondrial ornithine carrier protein, putative [Candida dubliniensis CD36]CAX42657.1 mitochondrial ornithine carrier protein, putative [Candida dubliniensis CD36]